MWASRSGKPDSTATRFAELYAQALDRLADPRAPLRIGALHTLEAISQDYPSGRAAIVDVICAYLRMPQEDGSRQEDEVRLTAQRILEAHMRPGPGPTPVNTFWPDIDLDLTSAELANVDLSNCRVRTLRLTSARVSMPGSKRCARAALSFIARNSLDEPASRDNSAPKLLANKLTISRTLGPRPGGVKSRRPGLANRPEQRIGCQLTRIDKSS